MFSSTRAIENNGLMKWTIGVVKFKRRTLPWRFAWRVVVLTFVQPFRDDVCPTIQNDINRLSNGPFFNTRPPVLSTITYLCLSSGGTAGTLRKPRCFLGSVDAFVDAFKERNSGGAEMAFSFAKMHHWRPHCELAVQASLLLPWPTHATPEYLYESGLSVL